MCERSDGTKYEGQWAGNRRNGFGITYYPGNIQDAGVYKDDVLLSGEWTEDLGVFRVFMVFYGVLGCFWVFLGVLGCFWVF